MDIKFLKYFAHCKEINVFLGEKVVRKLNSLLIKSLSILISHFCKIKPDTLGFISPKNIQNTIYLRCQSPK